MRTALTIAFVSLLGGCSFFDELDFSGQQLDPNRVYLGTSRVYSVAARDTDKYACISGPLMCETRGIGFDCRCP